jgi:glycine cleavage system transcriptional repressor
MAEDRVGIVADATTAIRNLGGNLADMSQTVLRGYFTMILIGGFPDGTDAATVRAALKAVEGATPFEVGVHEAAGDPPAEVDSIAENQYVLTALGPDRTGLVSTVTEYLRQKEINICDLSTCVDGGVYTMILLLDLPVGTNVARLKHSLQVAMEDVALSVELRHHALFRHTNEI